MPNRVGSCSFGHFTSVEYKQNIQGARIFVNGEDRTIYTPTTANVIHQLLMMNLLLNLHSEKIILIMVHHI